MAEKKKPGKKESQQATAAKATAAPKKKSPLLMIGIILMGAVFLPSSVLLCVGMLPTFAALFAEARAARTKVVTVGAINLAGCFPFLLDLWSQGYSLDNAISILSSPLAIIVMYAAAAVGYLIDWALTSVVSGILYQRGLARKEAIIKRHAELAERWGQEVTGMVPLDDHGFAMSHHQKDE